MSLEMIKCKTLQATIWDCDRFQENMFLGAVTIPMENVDLTCGENTRWYKLTNYERMSKY
jgi:phosphatidylinositol-4-phosphate 3-kinase